MSLKFKINELCVVFIGMMLAGAESLRHHFNWGLLLLREACGSGLTYPGSTITENRALAPTFN